MVEGKGIGGGLAVLWRKEILFTLQSFSKHHIDGTIEDERGRWWWTGFYGHPETSKRKETWALLRQLHSKYQLPWILSGDFNEILWQNEKQGMNARAYWQIQNFWDVIANCGFEDLGFEGFEFTWLKNTTAPLMVCEQLERCFANKCWIDLFPKVKGVHLASHVSDHITILLDTNGGDEVLVRPKRKRFRFESMWVKRETCEEIIQLSWSEGMGDFYEVFKNNIEQCRVRLLQWNASSVGHIQSRVRI